MCTRTLICSTKFAPPRKVEQIRDRVLICTRVLLHKTPFIWPNTPQVQIYTLGVYLHWGVYCAYKRGFRSNCTYVITSCVHVRNLHLEQMCTRVLICSTEFAPPTKVEQIRTWMQICTRMHFHKTPFTWPKYTPVANLHQGVYLHRGVYCAHKRDFYLPNDELRVSSNAYESITIQSRCLSMHHEFVASQQRIFESGSRSPKSWTVQNFSHEGKCKGYLFNLGSVQKSPPGMDGQLISSRAHSACHNLPGRNCW